MRSLRLAATVFSVLVLAACADDGAPAPADDVRDRRDAAEDAATPDASAPDVEEDVTIDLGQPDLGRTRTPAALRRVGDAGAGDAYEQRAAGGRRVSWEQVELLIPAGTFDEPVDIRISIADDITAPPNVVLPTSIYRFEPAGLRFLRGVGVVWRARRAPWLLLDGPARPRSPARDVPPRCQITSTIYFSYGLAASTTTPPATESRSISAAAAARSRARQATPAATAGACSAPRTARRSSARARPSAVTA